MAMNTISSDLVIRRTELTGSEIDDEMVFFNHETGKYFATGPVGSTIWQFLDAPKSISEVCEFLLDKYEVDRSTCETQVQRFVGELIDGGIVVVDK